MSVSERRDRIVNLISDGALSGTLAGEICGVCVGLSGVDGAAMAVLANDGTPRLVHATDDTARRLHEVQSVAGRGPGRDVVQTRAPVLVADLEGAGRLHWPQWGEHVGPGLVAAMFCFPLQVGAALLGVFSLHRASVGELTGEQLADVLVCADLATETLLATPGPARPTGTVPAALSLEVAQATGRVMAQLDLGAVEALLRLQAHARASGLSVSELAARVNGGHVPLKAGGHDRPR